MLSVSCVGFRVGDFSSSSLLAASLDLSDTQSMSLKRGAEGFTRIVMSRVKGLGFRVHQDLRLIDLCITRIQGS